MGELNQESEEGQRLPGNQQRALVDTHTNFARATDSIAIDLNNGSLIQGKLAFRELPK